MGIIPRGTANAFSVALGIPTHLDDASNFAIQAADVILQVSDVKLFRDIMVVKGTDHVGDLSSCNWGHIMGL